MAQGIESAAEPDAALCVPRDAFGDAVAAVHECVAEGKLDQAFMGLRSLEESVGRVRRARDVAARRPRRGRRARLVDAGDAALVSEFTTQQEVLGSVRARVVGAVASEMRAATVPARRLRQLWRLASALGDETSAHVFCERAVHEFEERAVAIRRHLDTVRTVRMEGLGGGDAAGAPADGDDDEQPFESALFEVLSTAVAWMEASTTAGDDGLRVGGASVRAKHQLAAAMQRACEPHAAALLQLLLPLAHLRGRVKEEERGVVYYSYMHRIMRSGR
jgi:hypothetical protein